MTMRVADADALVQTLADELPDRVAVTRVDHPDRDAVQLLTNTRMLAPDVVDTLARYDLGATPAPPGASTSGRQAWTLATRDDDE